ncbi:hypothetical protein EVAR_68947_1 [Eumeta japonica]|uniref:Uncharacterized protein n=1 Tax=Eumeta variegata TaxID=151549 RepID=A0A4C2A7Z5_EUMVA|nr:hypothetical protein EVAR_68947_1 [Eumeta japonica]
MSDGRVASESLSLHESVMQIEPGNFYFVTDGLIRCAQLSIYSNLYLFYSFSGLPMLRHLHIDPELKIRAST